MECPCLPPPAQDENVLDSSENNKMLGTKPGPLTRLNSGEESGCL